MDISDSQDDGETEDDSSTDYRMHAADSHGSSEK